MIGFVLIFLLAFTSVQLIGAAATLFAGVFALVIVLIAVVPVFNEWGYWRKKV